MKTKLLKILRRDAEKRIGVEIGVSRKHLSYKFCYYVIVDMKKRNVLLRKEAHMYYLYKIEDEALATLREYRRKYILEKLEKLK